MNGAFEVEYIETGKLYHSLSEFTEDFHLRMRDLKLDLLDGLLINTDTIWNYAWMIENGPDDLFVCYEVWDDGISDEDQGRHRKMKEETILRKVLADAVKLGGETEQDPWNIFHRSGQYSGGQMTWEELEQEGAICAA